MSDAEPIGKTISVMTIDRVKEPLAVIVKDCFQRDMNGNCHPAIALDIRFNGVFSPDEARELAKLLNLHADGAAKDAGEDN